MEYLSGPATLIRFILISTPVYYVFNFKSYKLTSLSRKKETKKRPLWRSVVSYHMELECNHYACSNKDIYH